MDNPLALPGAGRRNAAPAFPPSPPVNASPDPIAGIAETGDLRKSHIYEAPTIQLAYAQRGAWDKTTKGLPIGTQAKFIAAADAAAHDG